MPIEQRQITDRDEWLRWREDDLNGSTIAALLGLHPYCTPLQLYVLKSKIVPPNNSDSRSMLRGRLMESVAFEIIKAEHPEWRVERSEVYLRDPEKRIGVTLDFIVRDECDDRFPIEAKSVEPGVFRRSWLDEAGEIQVPIHHAIQALIGAHMLGAKRAKVAALRVGHGIDLDLIDIPETPGLIERIEAAAAEFWAAVERGQPPPPVFPADIDAVLKMASKAADADASVEIEEGDNYWPALIAEYVQNGVELREREARGKAMKAELLAKMGTATALKQNGRTLATAKLVNKKAEEKPREGYSYRDLRIPRGATP